MRVAYLLKVNLDSQTHLVDKAHDQISYWINSNDEQVEVGIFCLSETQSSNSKLDVFNVKYYKAGKKEFYELFYLFPVYKKLLIDLSEFNPDLIYTRTWTLRRFTFDFMRKFRVISEVNTKELNEYKLLAKNSIRSYLKYIYYRKTRHLIYNKLKGICCVTHEIGNDFINYGLKTIIVPNSIPLNNFKILPPKGNKIPKIFFIGSTGMPWQGFDIIIKLAKLTIGKLEFHIVGDKSKDDGKSPENVISYGPLKNEDYIPILYNCDVGLGTMALYRKDMTEACPLKVREYLAHGLPVILPYKDTAFMNDNLEWILNIPGKKGEVLKPNQVERIITFCYKVSGSRVSHKESERYIDAIYLEKERLIFFKRIISGFTGSSDSV